MACLPYYRGIEFPMNIIFSLFNIICSIVSVTGNSLTIIAIVTKPSLQSTSHWLLAALSFTDLLAGAIAQPMYGIYLSFFDQENNCVLEKSIVFMSATSCMTSILLLTVIAYDRYLHVSKGMRYEDFMNSRKIFGFVIGCWMLGLAIASTFMLTAPSWTQYLGFGTFSSMQLFCFIFITICYIKIQRIISAHHQNMLNVLDDNQRDGPRVKERLRQERVQNVTVLILLVIFVMVWFPFMIVLITGTVYQAKQEIPGSWMQTGFVSTAVLTYVNGAINPFIYAMRYRELGREIKKKARMIFRCIPHTAVHDSGQGATITASDAVLTNVTSATAGRDKIIKA